MNIVVDGNTKKESDAQEAAYRREFQAGHQAGMREGYTSRVKDEFAARWNGSRVTEWSCALCDNNQIELTLNGNMLDYDDADQIAATLIHKLNVIRAREAHEWNANDKKEEQND